MTIIGISILLLLFVHFGYKAIKTNQSFHRVYSKHEILLGTITKMLSSKLINEFEYNQLYVQINQNKNNEYVLNQIAQNINDVGLLLQNNHAGVKQ